ncbi:D-hexose-6-phosphate mutarotase [Amantichitinum ursilacus]|uniref:Putative glucose-6-phosphate 1-epimerase n=1 Tax=Amantichitinum ursilacus TaxID=857265 RepID=A0A0N0GPK7_9NEIS|nr:D-hexose-6-phosphate mutarotase [Amantichitinum ursilacus]KPC53831.1 putative glucose-6-phosphate 1-epimerase [Amantichitinum ursilacus]
MSFSPAEAALINAVPGISQRDSRELYPQADGAGLPVLVIENAQGRAVVALQGAHLMSFVPAGGDDLLWLSPKLVLQAGEAVRGGIPLCMPWFGAHPEHDDLPKHGFARNENWSVIEAAANDDGSTRVVLELRDNDASRALWPHAFVYRLAITVGSTLHLDLQAQHLGQEPQLHSFALHTYFAVPDVSKAVIHGLEGTEYIDTLPADKPRIAQEGELQLSGPTDRVYLDVPKVQTISTGKGKIVIESAETHCAVVWNPWENAARIADIGAGNYVGYVCVERGDMWDYSPTLQPGDIYHVGMTLSAE